MKSLILHTIMTGLRDCSSSLECFKICILLNFKQSNASPKNIATHGCLNHRCNHSLPWTYFGEEFTGSTPHPNEFFTVKNLNYIKIGPNSMQHLSISNPPKVLWLRPCSLHYLTDNYVTVV